MEWVPDSHATFQKNPTYWQQGLPHLDKLEFRPIPDTDSRLASIQNGDVDVAFGGYSQELVPALANPNLKVYYGPRQRGGSTCTSTSPRRPSTTAACVRPSSAAST